MIEVKKFLHILAILLFVSNYQICDYFYFVDGVLDKKGWWGLKLNIYAVVLAIIFYASRIGSKGFLRFILNIGIGFTISNMIDKCYYNVLEFRYNDIIMIILTVCFSLYEYLNSKNYAKQN